MIDEQSWFVPIRKDSWLPRSMKLLHLVKLFPVHPSHISLGLFSVSSIFIIGLGAILDPNTFIIEELFPHPPSPFPNTFMIFLQYYHSILGAVYGDIRGNMRPNVHYGPCQFENIS